MNKFLVVFATTASMVLLLCPNALGGRELSSVEEVKAVVLDLNGNPLKSSQLYSILLNSMATGLGVETINENCRLNIGPQPLENTVGGALPLIKIIDLGGSDMILEGAAVSMVVANMEKLGCSGSPVLQVVDDALQTGGTLGEDSFKITKVVVDQVKSPVYELQSCHGDTDSSCDGLADYIEYHRYI